MRLNSIEQYEYDEMSDLLKVLTTPPVNTWLDISAVQSLPDSPFIVTHLNVPPAEVLSLASVAV